ncbi:MAG: hypothetical protein LC110_00415 [Burkholderiales bacterium]|nr:hypothetical protein [Burkholderiales bacterium]
MRAFIQRAVKPLMDKRMQRFTILVAAVITAMLLLHEQRDAGFFIVLGVLGVLMILADCICEINEQYREYKRTGKLPAHVLERRRRASKKGASK